MRRSGALVGAAALALMGATTPSLATAADEPDRPDLRKYYTQKIKWSRCADDVVDPGDDRSDGGDGGDGGDGSDGGDRSDRNDGGGQSRDVECGTLNVPLDYGNPGRGSLDLALIRLKSSGSPRGSLVLNFGGPGGPGVSSLAQSQKEFGYLSKGYDVVSFDPRGVGQSSPVSCGDEAEPTEEGSGDGTADLLKELGKVAERCEKKSGAVLPYVGTVNVSRDLDVMRQALGDKKLNYLGFSYGTRLGAVYTAQFPHRVGRMVLDGVDTLTEPLEDQFRITAEGRQTALDNFLTWCTKNAGCPFGNDARSARTAMGRLVDGLDESPLESEDGQEFTGQDVVGILGQALYSRQAWPALSQALGALLSDGDPRALLRMSGAMPQQSAAYRGITPPDRIPADNMGAALMAVNCADDPDRPSAELLKKEVPRLREEFTQVSPVFGPDMLTSVLLCYGRPAGTDYIRKEVRNVDTPKFLLVGTRGDPATPYRWTTETAKRLGSSAVVLDNRGDGHTGYFGSKCVQNKVNAFLLYKELPKNGSSCAAE